MKFIISFENHFLEQKYVYFKDYIYDFSISCEKNIFFEFIGNML